MTESEYIAHVEHLRPLLLRVGRDFFRRQEEAEDVAQEVLMRLWLCRDRLPEGEALDALSVRIAKNVCISMWRRQKLRTAHIVPLTDSQQPAITDYPMENDENNRLMQQALQLLTPSERRLFLLKQEAEMTIDLMAHITGMQPRSVSSKLSAARRKVFEHIKQYL